MQELPNGTPNLVLPDLTKIDLPHLKRDITKYVVAGVFTAEAESWWKAFLDTFEDTFGTTPPTPMWYLQKLKLLISNSGPSLAHQPNVPAVITDMHQQMKSKK